MSRPLGVLEVVKPYHHTREADSMDHATAVAALLATHFATSLFPLTVRVIPVIAQIGRLIVRFRRADVTPQACYQFETQLQAQLRELGRIIVEWSFNHLEPHDRRDMPGQIGFQGVWYRRRFKSPTAPWPPCSGRSPCGGCSTSPCTAWSGRSFRWRSAWDWRPAWPRPPWPSGPLRRRRSPPRAPSWPASRAIMGGVSRWRVYAS